MTPPDNERVLDVFGDGRFLITRDPHQYTWATATADLILVCAQEQPGYLIPWRYGVMKDRYQGELFYRLREAGQFVRYWAHRNIIHYGVSARAAKIDHEVQLDERSFLTLKLMFP